MTVTAPPQRFTRARPCPVCAGWDTQQRGAGTRCYGYLDSAGEYARCTREEFAGQLDRNADETFSHRLIGACLCGREHATVGLRREIVAEYDYRDENGDLLYQVVRYQPKGFSQRRPDGAGGWTWSLNGARRVLYRQPEVRDTGQRLIFLVEGEKDCDRLWSIGLVATTAPGGAGKWKDEYSATIRGRRICIIPDTDEVGRAHADEAARSLAASGCEVRLLTLPGLPEHGDVSDWLDQGHTAEDLKSLARTAPIWSARPPSDDALPAGVERVGRARLYDLSQYSAKAEAAGLDWLIDEWIERGKIHLTAGFEKLGKTTKAMRRAAAVSRGDYYLGSRSRPGRVVVLTEMDEVGVLQLIEDDHINPDWSRLRLMFTSDYAPEERLLAIADVCREWKPDHLILDPIDECFGLDGDGIFNPSRSAAPFDLMRGLARTGVAIDALYHLNNQGRIANSYKFRSKPDHLYEMSGADASEVTIKYRGRLRAIPRSRRVSGNGLAGYSVTTLVSGQVGRPASTSNKVLAALRDASEPLGPSDVAAAIDITEEAARAALKRLVVTNEARKVDRGRYEAVTRDEEEAWSTL